MPKTREHSRTPTPAGRTFSERLYQIRDLHIEMESILQSLAALQDDIPCVNCSSVCCKEIMCRESVDSDFLRFVLGAQADAYSAHAGWYAPGSGCRLSFGRPLVCYEFYCEKFVAHGWAEPRQLSRAFKTLYAQVFAGQHMLVVEDISQITAHKLNRIHARLEALREQANAALRNALSEKLGGQSSRAAVKQSPSARPAD